MICPIVRRSQAACLNRKNLEEAGVVVTYPDDGIQFGHRDLLSSFYGGCHLLLVLLTSQKREKPRLYKTKFRCNDTDIISLIDIDHYFPINKPTLFLHERYVLEEYM